VDDFFGTKLLSSFFMLAVYGTFLSTAYGKDAHREADITLKPHSSSLARLCVTHFLTIIQLCLCVDPYFGKHWARSTKLQPLC